MKIPCFKHLAVISLMGAPLIAIQPSAHSSPTLRVSDGVTTVTVLDNGPLDSNPDVGTVQFFDLGVQFPGWSVNISTGVTKPIVGSSVAPFMDLNPSATSNGPGTLTVEFTDTDFGPINGTRTVNVNGGTNIAGGGTMVYSTFVSSGNSSFDEATSLAPALAFAGPGAQSLSTTGVISNLMNFSLTQKVVITHAAAGHSGADLVLEVPACTGKIGDFVWNDLNGNGCQDAGEPGIQGATVNLYSGCAPDSLAWIKTTTTDAYGKYLFSDLCAGDYTVSFVTPDGFTRTRANQACNVGGRPSDETDSDGDCDCTTSASCGVCVHLPTGSSMNLTIDCGYVGSTSCVKLTKKAACTTAAPGTKMVYTYTVTNCGGTDYSNLAIIDDHGTPDDFTDDFTVASGFTLYHGQTKTFTATVVLPTPLCNPFTSPPSNAGMVTTLVLPSGDIQVTFTQPRTLNDNVYGTPAPADGWGGHSFLNLLGDDKAEFRFIDKKGVVVLDFYCDYLSQAASKSFPTGAVNYPSGYGCLGANGGDGSMVVGNINHVLFATTSLTDNLNSGLNGGFPSPFLVDSPTPEAFFPNWDYENSYTVIVSKNAFGASGFGAVWVAAIYNSPAKTGCSQVWPRACSASITNVAKVVKLISGKIVGPTLATDNAVVFLSPNACSPPPCVITPGCLKIDKKTVQVAFKNNGTADIPLSKLSVNWNQAVNGNLVKIGLNGDVWSGSVASGTFLGSGFNSDASRRNIPKGQTRTLVLSFTKDASMTVADYSGVINFGSNSSCAWAFPPPAPVAPCTGDGGVSSR